MSKAPRSVAGGAGSASVSGVVAYPLFALLCLTNAITLVALLMAPDVARLIESGNDRVLVAHEDRIARLRAEVDRLYSREYTQAGNINLQMHELVQQQEVLLEQQYFVRALANRAAELGIVAAGPAEADAAAATLVTGAAAGRDVDAISRAVDRMMAESRDALAAISGAASDSTALILDELDAIGIAPDLPSPAVAGGVGGPYLPATASATSSGLVDEANAVIGELARFRAARDAVGAAPIHRPIVGDSRLSSNFGNRRDPFTGGAAFHAGVDYAAPTGTDVLSAGAGTVVFAGRNGGYGNMVDIDHGDGITTRYAHLSTILVRQGAVVSTGMPVGKVGSTGRSTGPHLHFEVRRNDSPLDPTRFLRAGTRLAQYAG